MPSPFSNLIPITEATKQLTQATGLPTPRSTWYKWAKAGKIPVVKLAQRYFIPAAWLAQTIATTQQETTETHQPPIITTTRNPKTKTAHPAGLMPSNSDGTRPAQRAKPNETRPATS